MKYIVLVAALCAPFAGHATGRFQCEDVAASDWLSEEELTKKVTSQGWSVNRMKKDGGCWEVYGNMPDGTRVEAYFHPVTAEAQYIGQRGRVLFDIRDTGN